MVTPKATYLSIYRIVNRETGREYIGLTARSCLSRWGSHRNLLLRGLHPSRSMVADMAVHGPEAFYLEELERVHIQIPFGHGVAVDLQALRLTHQAAAASQPRAPHLRGASGQLGSHGHELHLRGEPQPDLEG